MVTDRHRSVHQFLQERAGGAYRAAFYYDDEGWETVYVRGDIATNRLRGSVSEAVERARQADVILPGEEYPPLGETNATTEVHENGVIVHFPEGPEEGLLVSLDREVAARLTTFIDQAVSILRPRSTRYRVTAETD